jgi:ribosomal protein S26
VCDIRRSSKDKKGEVAVDECVICGSTVPEGRQVCRICEIEIKDGEYTQMKEMKLEIVIDENYIAELVSKEIARRIVETYGYENREARAGIRDGIDKAVKQYIYSKKDVIIDRVVDRATVEIVKKGLPKLLEKVIATDAKEVTP